MEEELPALVNNNVGLHWARLRPKVLPKDGHDNSYLGNMLLSIPTTLSRFDGLHLQLIFLGCTSISFVKGYRGVKIPELYRDLSLLSAFDAILFQLKEIQAQRIMLFAPYDASTINTEVDLLRKSGVTVAKSVSLPYEHEIRNIDAEQLYNIFLQEYIPETDAVLFSCTALYTLEAIAIIQSKCGTKTPLISSNTSIASTLNHYCQRYLAENNILET